MDTRVPVCSFPLQHVFETQQFSLTELEELFKEADRLRESGARDTALAGHIMCALFYEPSTRTRLSFESAMLRRGGQVMSTENAGAFSSAAKGESLEDTLRVVGHYASVIVLRHHDAAAARRATEICKVPVISAGWGRGQHPTQALLDVYTIWRHFGKVENLRVAMMGDLANGRTVRSLAYLLVKYPGVELYFTSPPELRIGQDIRAYLDRHRVKFVEYESVGDIIDVADVLYVTRPQLERMGVEDHDYFSTTRYSLHRGLAQRMKENSIIMHPLPRTAELSADVDTLPGAVYLDEQVENGLHIRMALLGKLLP